MTRDEIEDLFEAVTGHNIAHGNKTDGRAMYLSSDEVVEFAALVAAHEREACAKVCEAIYNDPEENNGYDAYYTRPYIECADAIRARGQG